jgi:hypothetical protein
MSSEVHQLDEASLSILHALMAGWMSIRQAKAGAELTPVDLSAQLGRPVESLIEPLAVLEASGLVARAGVPDADPTLDFKGVDEGGACGGMSLADRYYITEIGRQRMVAAALNRPAAANIAQP